MKRNRWSILLVLLGVIVQVAFYVSAFQTHTLDPWFENITPGQDFFQVPNAAFAVLHGGDLQGGLPTGVQPYIPCCGVNANVYHPVFTMLIGVPLSMLPPWTAYSLWVFFHLVAAAAGCFILWKMKPDRHSFYPAVFVWLSLSYWYYEIKMAQYHFLIAFFVLLILYEIRNRGDSILAGLYLFLSLIVKPIGLLFLVPLILAGYRKTAVTAVALFAAVTVPTLMSPLTSYYVSNIMAVSRQAGIGYNFYALSYFIPAAAGYFQYIKYGTFLFLLAYQLALRPHIVTLLGLWTIYQILFYSSVFPYYYVTLAAVVAVYIRLHPVRLHPWTWLPVLLLIAPTPALYFHLRGSPVILPTNEYLTLALWSSAVLMAVAADLILNPLARTRRAVRGSDIIRT